MDITFCEGVPIDEVIVSDVMSSEPWHVGILGV